MGMIQLQYICKERGVERSTSTTVTAAVARRTQKKQEKFEKRITSDSSL
jgi:hypothetical protein